MAIVDAKSLFDYLSKETVGGQDRRTSIEIQIIQDDLHYLQGHVRWIDHPAMITDGLTEIKGNNGPLYRLMQQGTFRIQAEDIQVAVRENAGAQG